MVSLQSKQKKYGMYIIIAFFSIMIFDGIYGIEKLNPTYVNWVYSGDTTQHYLGWVAYRKANWNFPIGLTNYLAYPKCTSVIFTDSIPIFAFIFKVLSPVLPENFQYLGLWAMLCFVLQGILAARIISKYSESNIKTIISSLLVVMMPTLFFRILAAHEALTAHWMILLALDLLFNSEKYEKNKKRLYIFVACVGFLAVAIHMYFLLMCGIIIFAYCVVEIIYNKRIKSSLLSLAIYCISALFAIWLFGGFVTTGANYSDKGVGIYNMNWNTFINPISFPINFTSFFLKEANLYGGGQYEGFGYLGIGVLVLVIISFSCLLASEIELKSFIKDNKRKIIGLLIVVFLTAITATQTIVSFGSRKLFELPYPDFILKIWGCFRASGRNVMVIDYVIVLSAIVILLKVVKKKNIAIVFMILVVSLQFIDMKNLFIFQKGKIKDTENNYVSLLEKSEVWQSVMEEGNIKHVIVTSWIGENGYYDVAKLAFDNDMTMSSFAMVHANHEVIKEGVQKYLEEPTDDEIFVFLPCEKLELSRYNLNYYDAGDYIIGYSGQLTGVEKMSREDLNKLEYTFSGNLNLINGADNEGTRTLFPSGFSYGPYCSISGEKLRISILGKNFYNDSTIVVQTDKGKTIYPTKLISKDDNKIVIETEGKVQANDLEIVVNNVSKGDILLEKILIEKIN